MADAAPPIDVNDIVGFDISLSLESGANANIALDNSQEKYDIPTLINCPIVLSASRDATGAMQNWFKGIIAGQSPEYDIGRKYDISLSCVSMFNGLQRKPINSQRYEDPITGQALLTELITTYGCRPAALIDVASAASTSFKNIVVNESSLLDACRMVSQAAMNEIFVNEDGKLITQAHKKADSAVETTIPDNMMKKASPNFSNEAGFSCIRVRGRYFDWQELNETGVLYDGNISWYNVSPQTRFRIRVTLSGIQQRVLENATLTSSNPDVVDIVVDSVQGSTLNLIVTVEGDLITAGQHFMNLKVEHIDIDENEARSNGNMQLPKFKGTPNRAMKAVGRAFQIGDYHRTIVQRSDKSADEREDNRIEIAWVDKGLVAEFGVLWEETDNIYIPTRQRALDVGKRNIQKFKQLRRRWEINFEYIPTIKLNHKVQFTVPESNPPRIVTGVLSELKITFRADNNELSMVGVVEDLSDDYFGRPEGGTASGAGEAVGGHEAFSRASLEGTPST